MLTTLQQLKDWLLAESLRAGYQWDDVIQQIGDGVTAAFDTYTNRTLAYTAAKTDVFRASLEAVVLSAYPVVSIAKVEYRQDYATGWVEQTVSDVVYNIDETSGTLQFLSALGTDQEHVRITYAGGYSTYPNDLLNAFRFQCERCWQVKDKLGRDVLGVDKPTGLPSTIELDPGVMETLQLYRRHSIL